MEAYFSRDGSQHHRQRVDANRRRHSGAFFVKLPRTRGQADRTGLGRYAQYGTRLLKYCTAYRVLPGLLIFLTVLAFNLIGDGLNDALDPKTKTNRG